MTSTALIVEVPESEAIVSQYRLKFDEVASRGLPAHITILFPFIPIEGISESLVTELQSLFRETNVFPFQLSNWERFDTALWLRPFPEDPFRQITEKIYERFPDYPPYEGKHTEIQPHLTVAQFTPPDSQNPEWSQIEQSTQAELPIECVAKGLSLYICDQSGHWKRHLSIPFVDIESK